MNSDKGSSHCPPPPAESGERAPGRRMLERLEGLLQRQFDLTGQEDYEGILALAGEARAALLLCQRLPDADEPATQAAALRVVELYRKLCLALAEKKQELAGQIARIQHGQRGLAAYRTTHE